MCGAQQLTAGVRSEKRLSGECTLRNVRLALSEERYYRHYSCLVWDYYCQKLVASSGFRDGYPEFMDDLVISLAEIVCYAP